MIYLTNRVDSSFSINDILAFYKSDQNLIVLYEQVTVIPENIKDKARFVRLQPLGDRFSPAFFATHIIDFVKFLFTISLKDWKKIVMLGGLKEVLINYQNALHKYIQLNKQWLEGEEKLLSFWFYDLLFPIILKQKGAIKTLMARSHRGDTYEGELGVRNLWLRHYQFRSIDVLHPISKHGEKFLHTLYPMYADKISYRYLGSIRHFDPQLEKTTDSTKKIFVSCSWINNKKNVHLIPELLSNLNFDFHWFHFGSGPEKWEQKLNDAIDRYGIKNRVTLMGNTPNIEIQRFYSSNFVDVFISLSSTEGVPVSFMEAISYGIPVFATDVGGNREIINDENGVLVELNESIPQKSETLKKMIEQIHFSRQLIIDFWQKKFNLVTNNEPLTK